MTIQEARVKAFEVIRWEGQLSVTEYLAALELAAQFLVNGPAQVAPVAPSEGASNG